MKRGAAAMTALDVFVWGANSRTTCNGGTDDCRFRPCIDCGSLTNNRIGDWDGERIPMCEPCASMCSCGAR